MIIQLEWTAYKNSSCVTFYFMNLACKMRNQMQSKKLFFTLTCARFLKIIFICKNFNSSNKNWKICFQIINRLVKIVQNLFNVFSESLESLFTGKNCALLIAKSTKTKRCLCCSLFVWYISFLWRLQVIIIESIFAMLICGLK